MFSQRSVHNVDVVVIVVVIAVVGTCTVQTFPNPLESPLNISSMLLYRQWHNVAALCLCDNKILWKGYPIQHSWVDQSNILYLIRLQYKVDRNDIRVYRMKVFGTFWASQMIMIHFKFNWIEYRAHKAVSFFIQTLKLAGILGWQ